jgi:AcrR family transcriptional regulator
VNSVPAIRRRKFEPDPGERSAILSQASKIVSEGGLGSLTVAHVLSRTQLGTRAFYRHFDSKDALVSAMFLEMARIETRRLRRRMATARDPIGAVAAWIDGRLDLAFNGQIRSDLRKMSLEANSQMFAAPELVNPAYAEMLAPLVESLRRGRELGVFTITKPGSAALAIQGAVWATIERQWARGDHDIGETRELVQDFCLRGLGVAPKAIAAALKYSSPESRERYLEKPNGSP